VINCAAFTDVDGAEDHEGAATAINGDGVGRLARRCADVGAVLVHYSTDYVFDGQAHEPYVAEHPRAPINAYGRSKARGEELLVAAGGPHILLRTSWLYAPWGKNFVLTMRDLTRSRSKLNVVADQVGRPTSAQYLARRSLELLRAEGRGTFHVTDGGMCSWYELAREVAAIVDADCRIEPCTSADFPRPAPRPAYSVLDLTRVESVLGPSRPWRENVRAVLAQVE
jgi:dTDP-4-dehydrorhamnose reductase